MSVEIWKPVIGHPGYEVSSLGKLKLLDGSISSGKPLKHRKYTSLTLKGNIFTYFNS